MGISFTSIIMISIRTGTETLGRLPETDLFCDVHQYPMALNTSGVLILRVKSSLLCFANANFVTQRYLSSYVHILSTSTVMHGTIYVTTSSHAQCLIKRLFSLILIERIVKCITQKEKEEEADVNEGDSKRIIQLVIIDASSKFSFIITKNACFLPNIPFDPNYELL